MTKSAEIIRRALSGQAPQDITAATGFALSTVYTVISKARRRGAPIREFSRGRTPKRCAGHALRFHLHPDAARHLSEQAHARGITPGKMARVLIETIAEDNLFNAVLE